MKTIMDPDFPVIPPIDTAARKAVEIRQSQLTKPLGSLGRLESLAIELAGIQGRDRPSVQQPHPQQPMDVLAKVGGLEIAGLVGVILGAAASRIAVCLDGFIASTAAMLAVAFNPAVKPYLIATHQSVEIGHRVILDHLGLKPLFDLGLRLGEGSGAALAFHLLEAAVRLLNEMATFAEAGVSDKKT